MGEGTCATVRLLTSWKLLACSQWWYWRWARVKSDINNFDCTFVYGGFVGSDEGSVPLSANIFIFPPISFRNPYHFLRKDKLVVAG